MRRGDQVIAKRNLGHMRPVAKGSAGVVRSVSFLGTYTVDFGSGRVLTEVKRADIEQAGGCALFGLVGCLCATVALGVAGRRLRSSARL